MTDELDIPVFDPTGPLWPEERAVVEHFGERLERELHIRIVETAGGATIEALDKDATGRLKQLAERPEPEHEEDLRLGVSVILARLAVADAWSNSKVFFIVVNEIGWPLQEQGRLSAARRCFAVAAALARWRAAQSPDEDVRLDELGMSLMRLAYTDRALGRLDQARHNYEQIQDLSHKMPFMVGDTSQARQYLNVLSRDVLRLADTDRDLGRLLQARRGYEQHYDLKKRIHTLIGNTPEVLRGLSSSLQRLGDVDGEMDRLDQARLSYEQKYELDRRIYALLVQRLTESRTLINELDISVFDPTGPLWPEEQAVVDHYGERLELALHIRIVETAHGAAVEALNEDAATQLKKLADRPGPQHEEELRLGLAVILGRLAIADTRVPRRGFFNFVHKIGDAMQMRGQLSAARRCYAVSNALARWRVAQTPGEEDSPRELGWGLIGLARADKALGRLDQARQSYEQLIELTLRIHAPVGDALDTFLVVNFLETLMRGVLQLADVDRDFGRLELARSGYEQYHELAQRIHALVGDTPKAQRGLGIKLLRVADADESVGLREKARRGYEQYHELTRRIHAREGDTPEALWDFRISLERLASADFALARLEQARAGYKQMYELDRRFHALEGDTPEALHRLGYSLERLASADLSLGRSEQACLGNERSHKLIKRFHALEGDTFEALRSLSSSLNRLANSDQEQGRFEQARRGHEQAYELEQRIHSLVGDTPQVLCGLSITLAQLAMTESALCRPREAWTHLSEALQYQLQTPATVAVWVHRAQWLSRLLVRLVDSPDDHCRKAFQIRSSLAEGLQQFTDLQPPDVVEHVGGSTAKFHAAWLQLALQHAPQEISAILSAMQGRKIAALVLEELEAQEAQGGSYSDKRKDFIALRTELRRLALGLRVISGGRADGRSAPDLDDGPLGERSFGVKVSLEVYKARLAEFEAKLKEYQKVRAQLAREPDFAALAPQLEIGSTALLASLAEGHGLLLLVQTPAHEQKDAQTLPGAHGLLLQHGNPPILIPLPELASLPAHMRAASAAGNGVPGLRYSGEPGALKSAPADLDASPAQALWTPLQPHLQGLHTLHVVTHGELHILPLTLGAPEALRIYQYPGLVFYWLQHMAPQREALPRAADPFLALQVHSPAAGEDPPPIPFVHAEAQMVQGLWSPGPSPLRLDQELPVAVVHLAGHGQAGEEQDACLILGTEQRLGLHELLRSRLRPEIVYLSACLVGRTSEDLDGDPLGMVSAFFLRGARCVVAPLVPISDFYSPLLAVLFHHALRAQQEQGQPLDAHTALALAKAQLKSGRWPEPVEQLVRDAYRPVLAQQIEHMFTTVDPRNKLMSQLPEWLHPPYQPLELRGLRDDVYSAWERQGVEAAARLGADAVIELLIAARTKLHEHPGVQNLLQYMNVYGAPAKRS